MNQPLKVAVVGLGALGSATAYHLSRGGAAVTGYDQFELGHNRGASHDTSRIVRRTYGHPDYVRLAAAAYRDWAELEQLTGQQWLTRTGGVTFFSEPAKIDGYLASLAAERVPYELLDGVEVASRWPGFQVSADVTALVQADTGIVHAARTTALLQRLAQQSGAKLVERCPVMALEPNGGIVTVHSAAGVERFDAVVVCADAWTPEILRPLGVELPLTTTLEQVSYFRPRRPENFAPARFPVWIWESDPCFYGFPTYGEATIKAARDCSGIPLDVRQRSFEPSAWHQRRARGRSRHLAGRAGGAHSNRHLPVHADT